MRCWRPAQIGPHQATNYDFFVFSLPLEYVINCKCSPCCTLCFFHSNNAPLYERALFSGLAICLPFFSSPTYFDFVDCRWHSYLSPPFYMVASILDRCERLSTVHKEVKIVPPPHNEEQLQWVPMKLLSKYSLPKIIGYNWNYTKKRLEA